MKTGRPTQHDVARHAGVSRQLVSLVIHNDPRVSDSRRQAVQAAMEELGYRPNAAAQSLVSRRSGMIGVVLSDLENPFFGELAEDLRRQAERAGLLPLVMPVSQKARAEQAGIERLLEIGVDGIILVSPLLPESQLETYGRLVPTLVMTRKVALEGIDTVRTDDREGFRQLTEHVVAGGYRPVTYVGPDRGVPGDSSRERIAGYQAAIKEAGGTPHRVNVSLGQDKADSKKILKACAAGAGFVAHNDSIALAVAGVLMEAGFSLGSSVGIAGFDNTYLSRFPGISLTSVDIQTEQLATAAVQLLAERMGGRTVREELVIAPAVVMRNSTQR